MVDVRAEYRVLGRKKTAPVDDIHQLLHRLYKVAGRLSSEACARKRPALHPRSRPIPVTRLDVFHYIQATGPYEREESTERGQLLSWNMTAVVYHKIPATTRPVVARVFRAQPCTISHYFPQK